MGVTSNSNVQSEIGVGIGPETQFNFLHAKATLEQAGADIVTVGLSDDRLDLRAVLADLGKREINDVLVESGPQLAGALADAGLVDEYVIYMAAKLLGDAGRGLLHMPQIATLADAPQLVIDSVEPVGRDWRITARPAVIEED